MTIKTIALAAMVSAMLAAMAQATEPDATAADSALERPDPGIGEGFANMMAEQFETAFGVGQPEADCLVYEVMTNLRDTGRYELTSVEVAQEVAPRCGLDLGG